MQCAPGRWRVLTVAKVSAVAKRCTAPLASVTSTEVWRGALMPAALLLFPLGGRLSHAAPRQASTAEPSAQHMASAWPHLTPLWGTLSIIYHWQVASSLLVCRCVCTTFTALHMPH